MPIEGKVLLDTGAAGLSLMANLAALLKEAKKKGSPLNIADIVERLPGQAFTLAGEFEREVLALKQEMISKKIDLKKSFDELEASASYWKFKQYRVIDKAWPRVNAIQNQLNTFFDDVVAVAQCREADEALASCFAASRREKTALSQKVLRTAPVGEVLDALLEEAKRLRAGLGDLS